MEWNDLRDEIGSNVGVYENPGDLSSESWTLMRFTEYENPKGDLEWLIRKDGCMHCADPGCLKACPAPGAIVQRSEEHTSELQSQSNLVCRLLLEKKKKHIHTSSYMHLSGEHLAY